MDDARSLEKVARTLSGPLVIRTAPAGPAAMQADCDCACPEAPAPLLSHPDRLDRLHLHDQAHFLDVATDSTLLYIPSTLTTCVISRALFTVLQHLRDPLPYPLLASILPEALLNRLIGLGILTGDLPATLITAQQKLVAWVHVTNQCNLRCTYCYLQKTDDAMSSEVGRDAIDAVVRSAVMHGYRVIKLKFAGGEASLNFPLIWELFDYAQQASANHGLELEAVILSNGVGLRRSDLRQLAQQRVGLMISVDGIASIHDTQRVFANGQGSFTAVAQTIARVTELGIRPHISVTVSGQTVGGLPALMEWLLHNNLQFNLNFYRSNSYASDPDALRLEETSVISGVLASFRVIEQHLPEHSLLASLVDRANLQAAHEKPCGVGDNYLVIDQQGRIAKCQMEIERPLTTIYERDPLSIIRLDRTGIQNPSVHEKEGCRDCEWQLWCAGGCPSETYRATQRYDLRSPNCHIYKALYPEALRLEGLRVMAYGQNETFTLGV